MSNPSRDPNLADSPPPNAFECRDRIRWSDSDPMAIVFYGAYIRLIGVAESEMFRACGLPVHEVRFARDVWIPRKALHLEFHSAAQLEEEVLIRSWFSRVVRFVGGTSDSKSAPRAAAETWSRAASTARRSAALRSSRPCITS